MEMEQENKVVRLNENPMENEEEVKVDDGGDERDENEISCMDKLPNEILMKILDYLDEQMLVKCRLSSSRWNEISCLLLQNKSKNNPYSKLVVHFQKIREQDSLECKTLITRSFDEFLDCFAPSEAGKSSGSDPRRPFPFSRFKITGLQFMERKQMTRFVPLFLHFKSLTLNLKQQDLNNFGPFWRLLLKFAPNIEHLGMVGSQWIKVELFEPYFNFNVNCDPFGKEKETQIKEETFLDKLKVFEMKVENISEILEMHVADFLEHVPNVQEISHYDWVFVLGLWQKLNRAHLLKKLGIRSSSQSDLPPAQLLKNLRLDYLWADCTMYSYPVENKTPTLDYVRQALKSSQETLSKCCLWDLTMESVKFCFKEIRSLPNVRQLEIHIEHPSEARDILHRFCRICPNTTTLKLGIVQGDFSQWAPILWTEFRNLTSLKFTLYVDNDKNSAFALDSAFSGYSPESIQNIQDKLDQGISLEEARRGEEQNPSILDLKGLSRLELEFLMGKRTDEMKKVESQLCNSVFMKILPQRIQEYPESVSYNYEHQF